jgi:hypothetical protein
MISESINEEDRPKAEQNNKTTTTKAARRDLRKPKLKLRIQNVGCVSDVS